MNKMCKPYSIQIFIAGDYETAIKSSREFCDNVGLCVTVTHTNYVYTGGCEPGVIIGLINYARFPKQPYEIVIKANTLADKLLVDLNQQSYTIQGPDFCRWYSARKEDNI